MRILWFTNILLPPAAKAMKQSVSSTGGWMFAELQALRQYAPDTEFVVLTTGKQHSRVTVDNVIYVTFGDPARTVFADTVPDEVATEVQQLIREFDPDLIHIHGTEDFYARLNSEILCNKPVLVSLQGIINGLSSHYNGNLTPKELAPFRTMRNAVFRDGVFEKQQKWSLARSAQEKISLSRHRHYNGRTAFDRAWLRAFNPQANYYHLDRAMRAEFFAVQRDPLVIRRHSVYCSAAAGYPLKGLHWLLRAAAIIKPKFPDIQIRVANAQKPLAAPKGLLARLKDSDYPAYLRHLIRELDLPDSVIALPKILSPEVAEELRQAHVFCLPSLCENSPNSLGEAMLAGTPSVAAYVGGVPSMLQHGQEGLLCPPADPAALADAIGQLFSNDKLAGELAANARSTAQYRHDPQRVATEAYKIYETVIKSEKDPA
jgi:glycosyltransferase involved in cell wall biosynthesis